MRAPFLKLMTAFTGALALAPAADAAERIRFQFGEFSRDVSVPSLVTFTKTGQVNEDLQTYLDLLNPPPQQSLRKLLSQSVPVTDVMASNFLSNPSVNAPCSSWSKCWPSPPRSLSPPCPQP